MFRGVCVCVFLRCWSFGWNWQLNTYNMPYSKHCRGIGCTYRWLNHHTRVKLNSCFTAAAAAAALQWLLIFILRPEYGFWLWTLYVYSYKEVFIYKTLTLWLVLNGLMSYWMVLEAQSKQLFTCRIFYADLYG